MDFLSKLRGSTEIREILSDGHLSIPRIVEDYEAVVGGAFTTSPVAIY